MIDHLIKADSEAAMVSLLGDHLGLRIAASDFGPACWRGDIAFPCQVLDTSNMVATTVTDQNGVTSTVQMPTPLPYFYLWIALPEVDPFLHALDGVMVIADRDAAERGEPFMIFAQPPKEDLYVYQLSPVVAGSNYPFGDA